MGKTKARGNTIRCGRSSLEQLPLVSPIVVAAATVTAIATIIIATTTAVSSVIITVASTATTIVVPTSSAVIIRTSTAAIIIVTRITTIIRARVIGTLVYSRDEYTDKGYFNKTYCHGALEDHSTFRASEYVHVRDEPRLKSN